MEGDQSEEFQEFQEGMDDEKNSSGRDTDRFLLEILFCALLLYKIYCFLVFLLDILFCIPLLYRFLVMLAILVICDLVCCIYWSMYVILSIQLIESYKKSVTQLIRIQSSDSESFVYETTSIITRDI